ncbi:hypothetical protein [Nocardia asiatica]|uniref:hypothetical protein n=1 Tax=Nocardia asiatica TaxID=209252 RepID=UPI0005C12970|nr:hypothetical protein [Nocardia asiatica]
MSTAHSRSGDGQQISYRTSGDAPADWPAELDAVVAAHQFHRVLFENDDVRVLEVYLEPGTVEPPHHHRWPSVLYLVEGRYLVDHDGTTGEAIMDTRDFGGLTPLETVVWKEPEALHFVGNPSESEHIRLVRVELKYLARGK